MIRLLLFEFEDTLIDDHGKAFPHVVEALKTMKGFETAKGERPAMCLVSAAPSSEPANTARAFNQLVSRVEMLGLRSFFEPVSQGVTLLEHAGAERIDQHIFEIAISRSGTGAAPDQSVFLSGDHDAGRSAKDSGFKTLVFGCDGAQTDFADWAEAPLLVAKILDSNGIKNVEAALRLYLAASENMDLVSLTSSADPDTFLGKVTAWHAITSEKLRDVSGVNVKLPAEIRVQLDPSGKVKTIDRAEPTPADKEEAAHFVESLITHGQIASESEVPPRGATHQINTDSEGRRFLVRKRFTAV
jgi:hypothetical protein